MFRTRSTTRIRTKKKNSSGKFEEMNRNLRQNFERQRGRMIYKRWSRSFSEPVVGVAFKLSKKVKVGQKKRENTINVNLLLFAEQSLETCIHTSRSRS
jgi:hypothetical protein